MSPGRDSSDTFARQSPTASGRVVIAVLAIVVGIPLALFAWIGGVFLVEALDLEMSSAQVLAWLLAAIVAFVVWPLSLRRLRRDFWIRQNTIPDPRTVSSSRVMPGSHTPPDSHTVSDPAAVREHRPRPMPMPAPTRGDAILRGVAVIVGAVGILALCGPRETTATAMAAWAAVSVGPREDGLVLQLAGMIAIVVLAAPAMIMTRRAIRQMGPDDPRRPRLEERQAWYAAAATAWVVCLGLGIVVSFAAILAM